MSKPERHANISEETVVIEDDEKVDLCSSCGLSLAGARKAEKVVYDLKCQHGYHGGCLKKETGLVSPLAVVKTTPNRKQQPAIDPDDKFSLEQIEQMRLSVFYSVYQGARLSTLQAKMDKLLKDPTQKLGRTFEWAEGIAETVLWENDAFADYGKLQLVVGSSGVHSFGLTHILLGKKESLAGWGINDPLPFLLKVLEQRPRYKILGGTYYLEVGCLPPRFNKDGSLSVWKEKPRFIHVIPGRKNRRGQIITMIPITGEPLSEDLDPDYV
ncbi:hypothetical protein BJ508DRAFT_332663 [Ascobolus immersus RN42]|uniref:Uncharacterized protein n=1 Tax=Ascobolus immersus RN42 TaxID=1160509 RepID=A0A3N4HSN2_ASCIM|nr:hypothetical protein BJ508DRAFT_332663 [Ascobolus immersus RN42]